MTNKEIVEKAYALLEDKGNWTTSVHARDSNDNPVPLYHKKACKFCAVGAIAHVMGVDPPVIIESRLFHELDKISTKLYRNSLRRAYPLFSLLWINDCDKNGHEKVLNVYKTYLEKAEDNDN